MTNNHWENARKLFREACFLRSMGDEKGAIGILSKDMPGTISSWMADSKLTAGEKKERLQEMFQEEMRKVDESVELCELMLNRFEETFSLQIRSILYDFQLLIYEVFGLDTSSVRTPSEPIAPARKRTKGKAPSKKTAVPIPPPSAEEMADRLRKFKETRLRTNKEWQSILFNDIEKIIDSVLDKEAQSRTKTTKSKPKTKRKSTRAKSS
jgi:hypothetical protein